MQDILELEAVALSEAMARGEITAEALMRVTLDRIAAVNGDLNAIILLRDEAELMAEARAADASPRKGWLHGIPVAVKDLANVQGIKTTMGSPIFADQGPAAKDDIMVARMRDAGAIFIGKTNTPEFGLGSHTFNPLHGATHNAYAHGRSAGGSSGGAAVALAARMTAVADGSDMMGSLRNPAGWNNVYGFRPSWALVPSEPLGDMFLHQLATMGPMGRSPKDIAALLGTMAGPDPRQPHGEPAEDYLDGIDSGSLKGKRIGWLGDWGGAYEMEPGILEGSRAALDQMAKLGAIVEEVPAPFDAAAIWDAWVRLRNWAVAGGTAALFDNPKTKSLMKPAHIWEVENGLQLSALDVHKASVTRSNWFTAVRKLFDQYDALILPSAQVWPFPVEWTHPERINGQDMATYHRWMEVVIPVSILGLPCLNIPAGFGENGLPLGLQLFGPRGADKALLQMGQAWHRATNWPAKRPGEAG